MLADVEKNALERLKDKNLPVKSLEVKSDKKQSLSSPMVSVYSGNGRFTKNAQKYHLGYSLFFIVEFRHLKDEASRREGIYPILESIVQLLTLQKLGLSIDALVPASMHNITDEDDARNGLIVWQLEFTTGFIIEAMSDEEVEDLLTVGLSYFLKPGDDIADAEDDVQLGS
jgi:hypothetical protein